ncbi:unnamed protein product [Chrysoparadoxa australica]
MPPCQAVTADGPAQDGIPDDRAAMMLQLKSVLRMDKLKAVIPKECFEKSLPKSLFYMFRDFALIAGLQWLYPRYVEGNWPLTLLWWNAVGFIMWALFVVGHDCGHTTFSNYPVVNAICGHICHAPLMVPFWPWAKSHHQHHMYHNHVEKDMSFPWFRQEEYDQTVSGMAKFILKTPIHPFFSYTISYLFLGYWDGSHFNPLSSVLFWNPREKIQAAVSVSAVVAWLYLVIVVVGECNWSMLTMRYFVPWAIYNYWLVMVTYMQHHEPDTVTYDDSDYNFAVAAMETIDRTYGWGLDDVHHNITDGHVVHHLFFTKIPHYNLKKATDALSPKLKELGVYKRQYNPNFLWLFIRYNYELGLITHSKAQDKWFPPKPVQEISFDQVKAKVLKSVDPSLPLCNLLPEHYIGLGLRVVGGVVSQCKGMGEKSPPLLFLCSLLSWSSAAASVLRV